MRYRIKKDKLGLQANSVGACGLQFKALKTINIVDNCSHACKSFEYKKKGGIRTLFKKKRDSHTLCRQNLLHPPIFKSLN